MDNRILIKQLIIVLTTVHTYKAPVFISSCSLHRIKMIVPRFSGHGSNYVALKNRSMGKESTSVMLVEDCKKGKTPRDQGQ
jgi:hypothetical protein